MAQQAPAKKFIPRHLEDKPSETDSFGGHAKIAAAIKEIIDNYSDEEGSYHKKPIGLLGNWGSGKSSVIKNLHSLYKGQANPETLVFEFDAWVYENDPIRRSFLEAFLAFLEEKGKTKVSDWEDDLNRIRRQKETHITESTPLLTTTGRTFSFSLMLFSIGLALLSNPTNAAWYLPIVIPMLFSPFVVVGGANFEKWSAKRKGKPVNEDDPVSLFFNKTKDTVLNNVVKTIDPTAIEFQEVFSRILDATLSNKKTRLIIVIDNLDRLPEDTALALWATMRSFFIGRNGNKHFSNLWVIVPLDPVSLYELFSKEGKQQAEIEAKVKSYVEKTFEITLRVGPPVLSTWEEFLIQKGKDAFDENVVSEDQWRSIARLYEVYLQSQEHGRETVTPRKIVTLINSISSLYRLWDEFPVETLALYAIFKDKIEKNIYGLIEKDFLPSTAISIADKPEWQKYVAALYYNTAPDKAVLILITDPLSNAFKEGQIDIAEKQISVPGGTSVAENIVQKFAPIWARTEPHHLFNMAYALGGLKENDVDIRIHCWRYIADAANSIESWQEFKPETAPGVLMLLNALDLSRVEQVSGKIITSLKNIQNQAILENEGTAKLWLDTFVGAEGYLGKSNTSNEAMQKLHLPESIKFRANIIFNIQRNTPKRALERFLAAPPKKNQKEFEQELSKEIGNRIAAGRPGEEFLKAINGILTASSNWDFAPIISAIEQILREGKNTTASLSAFDQIFLLSGGQPRDQVQSVITTLCRQGIIFDHFQRAHTKGDQDAAALCIVNSLKFNPAGNLDQQHGSSGEGQALYNTVLGQPQSHEKLVQSVVNQITPMFKVKELVELHRDHGQVQPLITAILNFILDIESIKIKVDGGDLINNFALYQSAFGETGIQKLVLSVAQNEEFFNLLQATPFTGTPLVLHTILTKDDNSVGKKYRSYASKELDGLTEEQWATSLTNLDEKLKIALTVQEAGKSLNFGSAFRTALEKHTEEVYNESVYPKALAANWPQVSGCLSKAGESTFYKNIRDKMIHRGLSGGFYKILNLFGSQIFTKGEFGDQGKADDVMRHLFIPMLANDPGVDVIRNNSNVVDAIFKNSSKQTQTSFIEEIRRKISDHFDDGKAEAYLAIAQQMKLKKAIELVEELKKAKEVQEEPQKSEG